MAVFLYEISVDSFLPTNPPDGTKFPTTSRIRMEHTCKFHKYIPSAPHSTNSMYRIDSGISYSLFSNNFATAKTTQEEAPTEFLDYLNPKWKGKIASTYPNDDDAVLFQ